MPRTYPNDDPDDHEDGSGDWMPDDEDDFRDPDAPEPWEDRIGDDDPTVPCPHCKTPIFDDAERCPACGRYVSEEDRPREPIPKWILVGAVLGLVAILWAYCV